MRIGRYEAGRITRGLTEYEIRCTNCEATEVVHRRSLAEAAADFRKVGWKNVRRKWFCPVCASHTTDEPAEDGDNAAAEFPKKAK